MKLPLTVVAALAGVGAAAAPCPVGAEPPDRSIPFELVGMVAEPAAINLAPAGAFRVADESDRWQLPELLAEGTDGTFAAEVLAIIDDRFPEALPAGRTLVIGIAHTGCFGAVSVQVLQTASGDIELVGEPHEDEGTVLCDVALPTVAIVAVDADDAPPGSTDGADLVHFEFAGYGRPPDATALQLDGTDDAVDLEAILPTGTDGIDLPPLAPLGKDERRFAFVRAGCRNTTAEMIVTRVSLDATLEMASGEIAPDCAQAEFFLAVFDIPASSLPPAAILVEGQQ